MAATATWTQEAFFPEKVLTAAPTWMRENAAARNVIPDRQFCYAADEGGGWAGLAASDTCRQGGEPT